MKTALELVGSFSGVIALIYLLDPLARRIGLLDYPGGRKDHAAPTPVTGGLAIALGTMAPALLLTDLTPPLLGLGLAAIVLIVTGVIDDLKDLRWQYRILAQIVAALCIVVVGGVKVEAIGPVFGLGQMALGSLSIPFTVLATVGLINALNMADGLDGLAGSMALCALIMLIAGSVYSGYSELTHGLTVLAGAVAGFLALNMRTPWRKRAYVFLGNSGSAYLGLVIAWAAFRLTQNPEHPVTPVLAPFLIAPPVIDCLVLIVKRLRQGRSPFEADRTHAHHLMLESGFTPTGVVLTMVAVSLGLGLLAGLALLADVPIPVFAPVYLVITVTWLWLSVRAGRAVALFAAIRRLVTGAPRPTAAKSETIVEPVD
ncbi:MAG: MraY family glycosyltransferase [Caulobacter sp.]|nr:MraY family glycosyltransferase [Caulobacter sp.]